MGGKPFDRLAKVAAASPARRDIVRAFAGSSLAALAARLGTVGVDAKKRRCRKLHQVCGKKKKCCGSKLKCDRITKSGCESVAGRRCCGRIGATCDNDADGNSHCDCCDGLFCSGASGLGTCTDTQP